MAETDATLSNSAGMDDTSTILDRMARLRQGNEPAAPQPEAPASAEPAGEAVAPLADSQETGDGEASPDTEEAEPAEGAIESLDDLIAVAGLEADQFDNLTVKLPGGDGAETTVRDLMSGHLRQADYTRKTQALAEERATIAQEKKAHESELASKFQLAESVINLQANELQQQYQAINWDELRGDDPAEWSAKQQEFQRRWAELQNSHQAITQHFTKAQAEQLGNARQAWGETEQKNIGALSDRYPEARDWGKFVQERVAYLVNNYEDIVPERLMPQWNGQELMSPGVVVDLPTLDLAWKAQQWDELQKKPPAPAKRAARRAMSARGNQPVATQQQKELDAARQRAREQPGLRSGAAQLSALRRAREAQK